MPRVMSRMAYNEHQLRHKDEGQRQEATEHVSQGHEGEGGVGLVRDDEGDRGCNHADDGNVVD